MREPLSPEKIRTASIPERKLGCWLAAWGGLGVVGREGMGVSDLDPPPFSALSLGSAGAVRGKTQEVRHVGPCASSLTFEGEFVEHLSLYRRFLNDGGKDV